MGKNAATSRMRLLGVLVALLLTLTPVAGFTGNYAAAAQEDDSARSLLDDAAVLAEDLDPVIEGENVTGVESEDGYLAQDLSDDAQVDFYLLFTAEAPRNGRTDPFDFGVFFRSNDDGDEDWFELAFTSSVSGGGPAWALFEGQDVLDSANMTRAMFPTTAGSTYEIEVAAIGDELAFAINGEAIAVVDISSSLEPGPVSLASGTLVDSTIDGEETEFTDITLFNLDANAPDDDATEEADETPTEEADDEPTEEATRGTTRDETPTTEDDDETPTSEAGEAGLYTSPTYGFTLEYDDTWEVVSEEATGNNFSDLGLRNVDVLSMNNGVSSVQFYTGESTDTAEECANRDLEYFQDPEMNGDRYEFFSVATDRNDEELSGETADGGFYYVIWVTDSGSADNPRDEPIDLTIYLECRPVVDGESMALIEQFSADDDYNSQIAPREALLAGFSAEGDGSGPAPSPTEEAETETPDAEVTEATTSDGFEIALDEVEGSGVDGDATLTASGSSRTTVEVISDTAPEGSLVVLQEGSCDDLSGTPDFEAGEIDDAGESSRRVRITPEDLDGNYAVTIIDAETEDYEFPLACGDIG